MRVQYTIPGINFTGAEAVAQQPALGFSALDQPPEVDWRDVLALNHPQPGDLVLPPPPRPASFTYADAEATRAEWTQLMLRHLTGPAASPQEARMLQTLAALRQLEQDLQVRILTEAKE